MQHIDLTTSLFTMICSCLLTAPVARPTAVAPSAALAAHNAAARPLERKIQRLAAAAVAATAAAAAAAPAHLPQADSALDDKLSSRPLELDAAGYFIIKVLIAAIVPPPAGQETCWPDRTCAPLLACMQHASQRAVYLYILPNFAQCCLPTGGPRGRGAGGRLLHQHHQRSGWVWPAAAALARSSVCSPRMCRIL